MTDKKKEMDHPEKSTSIENPYNAISWHVLVIYGVVIRV